LTLVVYPSYLAILNYMLTRPILLVEDDNGASNPAGKISGYDLDVVPSLGLG
jgi:hypothetical protein